MVLERQSSYICMSAFALFRLDRLTFRYLNALYRASRYFGVYTAYDASRPEKQKDRSQMAHLHAMGITDLD